MKKSKNALVILAGGQGKRFNNEQPKQFNEINGENLIDFFLNRIDTNIFDIILIVIKKSFQKQTKHLKAKNPLLKFIFAEAGKNRQLSSLNALKKLQKYSQDLIVEDKKKVEDDLTSLNISGRWNWASLKMEDQFGTALEGHHFFNRFNP